MDRGVGRVRQYAVSALIGLLGGLALLAGFHSPLVGRWLGADCAGDCSELSAPERQLLVLANEQRSAAGCAALSVDKRLSAAARGRVQGLTDGSIAGLGSDQAVAQARALATGYPGVVRENSAVGVPDAQQVVAKWTAPTWPEPRARLLDCRSRSAGVAYTDAVFGAAFDPGIWVMEFGDR
jgi:uncharacterized protein YkwD